MRHAGVRAAAVPGAGPVARAVAVVAQERAAALHALRRERPARVVGSAPGPVGLTTTPWPARWRYRSRSVPVGAPLPDVAGHVVQAVAVGRERLHRGGALEAVGRRCSGAGTRPARCWRSDRRVGAARRRPRRRACRPARRGRRTPTRPRSAAACRPTSRRRRRRPRRRGRRGDRPCPSMVLPGPSGCRQLAPGVHFHHCEKSSSVDRPVGRREHQRAGDELLRRAAAASRAATAS